MGGTDGQTDERMDIRITIYPRNFVCGGYNENMNYTEFPKVLNYICQKEKKKCKEMHGFSSTCSHSPVVTFIKINIIQ